MKVAQRGAQRAEQVVYLPWARTIVLVIPGDVDHLAILLTERRNGMPKEIRAAQVARDQNDINARLVERVDELQLVRTVELQMKVAEDLQVHGFGSEVPAGSVSGRSRMVSGPPRQEPGSLVLRTGLSPASP